jgi:hypothetical protein
MNQWNIICTNEHSLYLIFNRIKLWKTIHQICLWCYNSMVAKYLFHLLLYQIEYFLMYLVNVHYSSLIFKDLAVALIPPYSLRVYFKKILFCYICRVECAHAKGYVSALSSTPEPLYTSSKFKTAVTWLDPLVTHYSVSPGSQTSHYHFVFHTCWL